jgi:hypothetical protein
VTQDGHPVEGLLTPGAPSAVQALKSCPFDLPAGSGIDTANAYHDDDLEAMLLEAAAIQWGPMRKKPSTSAVPPWPAYVQPDDRKKLETVGSLIARMWPTSIHAVTAAGFELKVFLFVLAYSMNCL